MTAAWSNAEPIGFIYFVSLPQNYTVKHIRSLKSGIFARFVFCMLDSLVREVTVLSGGKSDQNNASEILSNSILRLS